MRFSALPSRGDGGRSTRRSVLRSKHGQAGDMIVSISDPTLPYHSGTSELFNSNRSLMEEKEQ